MRSAGASAANARSSSTSLRSAGSSHRAFFALASAVATLATRSFASSLAACARVRMTVASGAPPPAPPRLRLHGGRQRRLRSRWAQLAVIGSRDACQALRDRTLKLLNRQFGRNAKPLNCQFGRTRGHFCQRSPARLTFGLVRHRGAAEHHAASVGSLAGSSVGALQDVAHQEGSIDELHAERLVAATLACAGCVVAEESEDDPRDDDEGGVIITERLGEAAAPLTSIHTSGTFSTHGAVVNLGSDSDRTCFLRGVTGALLGWNGYTYAESRARVYRSGGNWYAEAMEGYGTGVKTHYMCITNVANRISVNKPLYWNTTALTIANSATGNRKCFISGLRAYEGFTNALAYAEVIPNGSGGYVVDGAMVEQTGQVYPNNNGGSVDVTCVDVPSTYYEWKTQTSGTYQINNLAGVACGVERIRGQFSGAPSGGLLEGVYTNATFPGWEVGVYWPTAGYNKQIRVGCIN
jgi:hypothetical protein